MIEFNCKNCGEKYSVTDKNAGRKGTCHQCKNPIVVPAPTKARPVDPSIIKFRCPNCNQKIGLKKEYAGKQVRCAKCKNPIRVPGATETPPVSQQTEVLKTEHVPTPQEKPASKPLVKTKYPLEPETGKNPFDGLLENAEALEALQQAEVNGEAIGQPQKDEDNIYKLAPQAPPPVPAEPIEMRPAFHEIEDEDKERKLPWPIDIFLFPASLSGIITIAVIVCLHVAHLFLGIIGRTIPFAGLAWFVMGLAIVGYVFWYFCECIRSSAYGKVRAGSNWEDGMTLLTLLGSALKQIIFVLLFWSPVIIYFWIFRRVDVLFWVLAISPWFLFPMALLSVTMFDSLTGYNPILWITSIFSTFIPYLGILLISFITLGLMAMLSFFNIIPFLFIATDFLMLWTMLVYAHLLGMFYCRYEEKLYWEA